MTTCPNLNFRPFCWSLLDNCWTTVGSFLDACYTLSGNLLDNSRSFCIICWIMCLHVLRTFKRTPPMVCGFFMNHQWLIIIDSSSIGSSSLTPHHWLLIIDPSTLNSSSHQCLMIIDSSSLTSHHWLLIIDSPEPELVTPLAPSASQTDPPLSSKSTNVAKPPQHHQTQDRWPLSHFRPPILTCPS